MRLQVANWSPAVAVEHTDAQKADVNYLLNSKYPQATGFQSVVHTTSAQEQCRVTPAEHPESLRVPHIPTSSVYSAQKRLASMRFQT